MSQTVRTGLLATGLIAIALSAGCERTQPVQRGYRGLAEVQHFKPATVKALDELNQIPEPEEPADPDSPTVDEVFKNVRVLNDLSATEFSRLMQALATWVAPEEGCDYCHNPKKLESDEKYTKIVARRMLQMTRNINTNWKAHVGSTGVTCWTCHRGQAVPSGDWFATLEPNAAPNSQGYYSGKNRPSENAGNSALPYDPLSTFLTTGNEIRVQGNQALATGDGVSIKNAMWTYSLMMYISKSLGVNCTYCHNTRAMGRWGEESMPQRATAWHGIRMVRELNVSYLIPLATTFPVYRLSAEGDGPKVGCATCHKGTFKPLNGVSPLKDYPVLAGVMPPPTPPVVEPAPGAAATSDATGVMQKGGGAAISIGAADSRPQ